MTPEQRYLFDVRGFLHLKGVLSAEELEECREATARYIDTPDEELPPGFEHKGWLHSHGFAFDKCLERLPLHPGIFCRLLVINIVPHIQQVCGGYLPILCNHQ